MLFKKGDRVKFSPNASIAAAGPPDRRFLAGTVVATNDLSGFANGNRISVLFDGEIIAQTGMNEALFESASTAAT